MAYATSTWAAIAAVSALAASAVGMVSAISTGQNAKAAGDAQARDLHDQAVKQNEANASAAWREMQRKKASEATQRVAFNVSGVSSIPGDTVDLVTTTTAGYDAMDIEALRTSGQIRVDALMAASGRASYAGGQAQTASYFQAGASLLTGAGAMASGYSGYLQHQETLSALKGK